MLQVVARLSVSALVASLPLLYVSLLRPPPAALAGDTAFWFLMSNCVIAAIVAADDAGTLFYGPSNQADGPCRGRHDDDDDLSYVSGGQPAAAFVEDRNVTAVPLLLQPPYDVPTAVNVEAAGVHQDALASTVTSSQPMHRALLPSMTRQDRGSKQSSTNLNHASVLPPRHGHGDDEVAIKPIASKRNNNVIVLEGQGEEEEGRHSPGSDEPAIIKAHGALAWPEQDEPWPTSLLTGGTGLVVDEAQEVEEIPEAWAMAQQSRTPDLQRGGKGAGEGKLLRRSVTEGSKPAAAEDRDYWELSDEELNRRVEEFIARFNREMRRQVEQEAAAAGFVTCL